MGEPKMRNVPLPFQSGRGRNGLVVFPALQWRHTFRFRILSHADAPAVIRPIRIPAVIQPTSAPAVTHPRCRNTPFAMNYTILWIRLDLPGHEFCRLEDHDGRPHLSGTAVFAYEGMPCRLDYRIRCDSDWRTRSAAIVGFLGNEAIERRIEVTDDGQWLLNGEASPSVSGCLDIDLGFSPSTNMLPIRRLSLGVGKVEDTTAAWLPFPALRLEPLSQSYHRVDTTTYRYESDGGAFTRTLETNEIGMVTHYPGLWKAQAGPLTT